jgi:hypothetical protein
MKTSQLGSTQKENIYEKKRGSKILHRAKFCRKIQTWNLSVRQDIK